MIRRLHYLLLRVYRYVPRRGRRLVVRLIAPTFSVGAMCFVERDDGRVLLVQHSYRRRWGSPGGLLQKREQPALAARREVREETGLDVDLVAEPTVVVDARARRIDIVFRCRPARGADADSVRPTSPEIMACQWFAPEALPELQFETAEALQALARASAAPPATPLIAMSELLPGAAGATERRRRARG